MNKDELTHTIRAARNMLLEIGCDIDNIGFGVIGSQSVIGSLLIDEARAPRMIQSAELDLYVLDDDEKWADYINGALGEDTLFHTTYGYYADGINIHSMVFPLHWKSRAIQRLWLLNDAENNAVPVLFMELHDLIVSKLYASRGKDLNFVAAAKHEFYDYIDREKVMESSYDMPLDIEEQEHIIALFDSLSAADATRDFHY